MEWSLTKTEVGFHPPYPNAKEKLRELKTEIERVPELFKYAARHVNPCEYLSTDHPVISRAYFKMYEALMRYEPEVNEVCNAVFLCEAPGGFQQATEDWMRKKHSHSAFLWHAVTLPQAIRWEGHRGSIIYADITKDSLPPSCFNATIVTGDGGFDCDDLNRQEELNYPLIESQMLKGLDILQSGGTLFVKMYDLFEASTKALIIEMSRRFERSYILKPWGSRICNSERYFVGIRRLPHDISSIPPAILTVERLDQIASDYAKVQISALERALSLCRVPGAVTDSFKLESEKQREIRKNVSRLLGV